MMMNPLHPPMADGDHPLGGAHRDDQDQGVDPEPASGQQATRSYRIALQVSQDGRESSICTDGLSGMPPRFR
jgi:hypothetical protein